jgi:radical SAM superfamily enzyme YgiQ (UPF0313 family)
MQVILFTDVADTLGYGKYAGTYKVATEVRNAGYTCQVVDLFSKFTYQELENIINKFVSGETVLIGFSCTLMEKRVGLHSSKGSIVYNFGRPDSEVESLVNLAKSKSVKLKTAVGGARINTNAGWSFIDYAVINKGDIAIVKLIEHLLYGNNLPAIKTDPLIVIDGSSSDYFYSQEQFATSKIIYQSQDIILPGECLPIEIARGCIFSCAYCHFDLIGKRIGDWQKEEDSLRDELLRNYELYGTTHYMVSDELINESLPKMELIHKVFTTLPFKITYTSYARLDLISAFPQMRDMLQESGAVSISFGIETMNDVAGKKIGKGLGKVRTKAALRHCAETWKGKIVTSSQFIVGLPGENETSMRETVDWLVSDECDLDIFGFLPLFIRPEEDGRSSSKIDRDPVKFGYVLHEDKPWKGEHMDFQDACKLVSSIYSDPRVQNKSKFGAATWMGRILNLGYTVENVFAMIQNPILNKKIITNLMGRQSIVKKNEYYTKLMEV